MRIFYSWQSDTPRPIDKSFIRAALDTAVSEISENTELDEADRPFVDQDTQGVLGSPAIVETILRKIRGSDVVVVDVTLVGRTAAGKKLINSNVAYELGYAHGFHDLDVLLAVMNTHYGSTKELPFDLTGRRWPVTFELAPDATRRERKEAQKQLSKEFSAILRKYLEKDLLKNSLSGLAQSVREKMDDLVWLDHLVLTETRAVLGKLEESRFPLETDNLTVSDVAQRLQKYEAALSRLITITTLLAKWGTQSHQHLLEKITASVGDIEGGRSGKVAWLALRYYPVHLLIYSGGIAALSAKNYTSLATLLTTEIGRVSFGNEKEEAALRVTVELSKVDGLFGELPEYKNYRLPKSEYLLRTLRANLDELLLLGGSYNDLFDRFEAFHGLVVADIMREKYDRIVIRHQSRIGVRMRGPHGDPCSELLNEATKAEEGWLPLASGLFGGSFERFRAIAGVYCETA